MDFDSGTFGHGGEAQRAVALTYAGSLGDSFAAFALNRAHRLCLDGWISLVPGGATVAVQGPQALVDAFEIVCSLGPIDARITAWDRRDIPPFATDPGFVRR